ncbi:amidase [Allosphingosinicella deserti]|uniref:Amidase n=1 Tax=Allosphingosinicella deserti TaxID=2116704 RepID=A0A2P7QE16_9SPHN|nr:amidase [Sphingomonas deserti]PSJ36176.1 amidase [Sphingomonas deserti]
MRLALLLSTALAAAAPVAASWAGAAAAAEPAFSSAVRAEANTKAALQRIKRLNPKVNAVIAVDPTAIAQARALDRARKSRRETPDAAGAQPLFGMPVLIKDNIEAIGPLPTTAGSLALKDNVTNRDAPLVARLRRAGAVIVGKTNLSEWANIRSNSSISGWSAVGGQTRNPFALNRNPCGSSSGSGAAVAAGMVPAAIGTETDGSITCPAAINGIVGFKPTVGLVSRTHVVPISHSQDTAGPMTRSVRDAALVLSVIAGSDPADPATAEADRRRGDYAAGLSADSLRGKRIGVMRFAAGFGTDAAFKEALATLRREGAVLVDIAKFEGRDEIGKNEFIVLLTELKADLNGYLATTPPSVRTRTLADVIAFNQANAATELALFGQETFVEAEATKGLDDPDYKKARATSLRLAGPEGIDRMLKEHDVVALVGPTMAASWPIDAVHGDQISGGGAGGLAAVAGYPHLTVPMGSVKGLPVGLSFIGPKWSDAAILSLGYDFEQASHKIMTPTLLPSIEESPEIAPHLRPAAR